MTASLKKLGYSTVALVVLAAFVVWTVYPRTAQALTLESTTVGTSTGDQSITVPASLSNVVIVYCSVINDADGAHTTIDGNFTFDGNVMTSAFTQVNQGNYHVQCYYFKNYTSSGAGKTMHYGNHGGFGTIQWAVYIISGADITTQPDTTATGSNAGSANPSTSFTTVVDGALAIEAIGGSNSLTAASSQTVDGTSDTNLRNASKVIATAGATSLAWTMSSGSWAQGIIAVKPAAAAAPSTDVKVPDVVVFE